MTILNDVNRRMEKFRSRLLGSVIEGMSQEEYAKISGKWRRAKPWIWNEIRNPLFMQTMEEFYKMWDQKYLKVFKGGR